MRTREIYPPAPSEPITNAEQRIVEKRKEFNSFNKPHIEGRSILKCDQISHTL